MCRQLGDCAGADSPPGSVAPSHLELRHSLQVLGCSGRGPDHSPPRVLMRRITRGRDCGPRRGAVAPGLSLSADQGSGRGPPTPPPGRDPRPRNPAKSGPPKGRIFPDFWGLRCSAQGGWGGSAHYPDPTAQSVAQFIVDSRAARATAVGGSGPALGDRSAKNREKFSFFLRKVVFVSGWTNGGVAIACGDVAVGGGRGRRLPHCLRSATLGVGPSRARFPALDVPRSQPTGGRGRHSGTRAAFGSRKRPRPSRTCDAPARDCRPLL